MNCYIPLQWLLNGTDIKSDTRQCFFQWKFANENYGIYLLVKYINFINSCELIDYYGRAMSRVY